MPYIKKLSLNTNRENPFPYNVNSVRFAKDITLDSAVTFFIGDNGTGKSTLIETLACWLQLPHMDGNTYSKDSFSAARTLVPYLDVTWGIDMPTGFFFRAEDFGDLMNSATRRELEIKEQLGLYGELPEAIIQEMVDNSNYQKYSVKKDYGQELDSFSHGEAYLQVLEQQVHRNGIFILDEPEAALSPSRQLALIHYIKTHISSGKAQYIIASHSPILMAFPEATIYEITQNGMEKTALEDTEHFSLTRDFLNNPDAFLRGL